jgi:hypothetical protein
MTLPEQPDGPRSATHAGLRVAAYVVATSAIAAAIVTLDRLWLTVPDADQYLRLAHGNPVMLPFASRQLGPLLVRLIAAAFHLTIESAYLLQGIVAFLVFAALSGWLLLRCGAPRWIYVAIAGMLFWGLQGDGLVLPDLLYSALLAVLLVLLSSGQLMAAALMMFPLMVSRESTLLTLLCFLLAGWRRLRWTEAVAAIAAALAGLLVVKKIAVALPNHEHIPPFVYLVAKMPFNLARNFGLIAWANLYPACAVPRSTMALHLGSLQSIGFCNYNVKPLLQTLVSAPSCFGLLPLLLVWFGLRWAGLRRVGLRPGPSPAMLTASSHPRSAMLLRFALIYGVIGFLLAPALGATVARLFAYAWPAFLVAVPLLIVRFRCGFRSSVAMLLFVALHLVASWTPKLASGWPAVLLLAACYVAGWLLLRGSFQAAASRSVTV